MIAENKELVDIDPDAEEDNYVTENPEESAQLEGLELDKLFKLEAKIGQTPICAEEREQIQTLMVRVHENSLDEERLSQASLDLVCVIDCSGSMNGFKLTQVQQSLVYLMEMLQPTDRLAIVAFNSQAAILNSLRLVTKENKCGKLLSNIQSLTAVGGTNIVGGLKKAYQILSQRTTKNRVSSIFLLSDGNDNFDLEGLDPLLKACQSRNYSINTFGYGEDHDPESLRNIAESNKGNFYYIKDLARVDESFIDCLALLTSVIGGKAKITVKLVPTPIFKEIAFKQCYGTAWKGEDDCVRTVDLGFVYVGMDKNYISEIVLDCDKADHLPADILIAEITLEMQSLKLEKAVTLKHQLKINVVKDKQEVTKDPEVEKHYLRVTGATVLNKAREFLDNDKFEEAEKVFETFKSRLGKISVNDIVLDNLTKQANFGHQYLHNYRAAPVQPHSSSFGERMREKKTVTHCLNQQAAAFMNEQSAPEWNRDMYQNKRQRRFMDILSKFK